MSILHEFLIKNAGIEKSAKRGIVKWLERNLKEGNWGGIYDRRVRRYVYDYLGHVNRNKKKFLASLPEDYAKFLQDVSYLKNPKEVLGEPTKTFFGIYDASPVGSHVSQSLSGTPLSRLRANSTNRNIVERLWDSMLGPKTRRWNVNDSYTDEDIKFLSSMSPDGGFGFASNNTKAATSPLGEVVLSNNTSQHPRLIKALEGYSNLGHRYRGSKDPNLYAIAERFPGHVYYEDNLASPELLQPSRLYHGGKELPDTPTYTGKNLSELKADVKKGVMQDSVDEAVSKMKPLTRSILRKPLQAYAKHVDDSAEGLSWYAMSPGQAMNYALRNKYMSGRPYFIDPVAKRQIITDAKRIMDYNYANKLWTDLSLLQYK